MQHGEQLIDLVERELRLGLKGPAPWVVTCKMPLRDSGGGITGLVGISKTITSTKDRMDHIRMAVDYANDGLWYRNYQTGEAWYSTRWKGMLGYNDEDLPNDRTVFRKLVFPEDWPEVERTCTDHLAGKTPLYECLFRMKHRDGHWRWVHSRGKVRLGSEGRKEEFAGSHTDITDYKVITDLYKEILEMLPVLVFLKDGDRRFRYVNKTVGEYLNRPRDTIIGKRDEDVNPDNSQAQAFLEHDLKILRGEAKELVIEEEALTHQPSGKVRRLRTLKRLLSFPSNEPQSHVLGVATDITDTLAAKEQLKNLRDSLAERLKALTDLVVDIEKSTSEQDASETAVLRLQEVGAIFGYPSVMISFKRVIDGRPCIIAETECATGLWRDVARHTKRWCDLPQSKLDIIALVLEAGRVSPVGSKGTTLGRNRSLLVVQNPPPRVLR